jgi:hypothetical protein
MFNCNGKNVGLFAYDLNIYMVDSCVASGSTTPHVPDDTLTTIVQAKFELVINHVSDMLGTNNVALKHRKSLKYHQR